MFLRLLLFFRILLLVSACGCSLSGGGQRSSSAILIRPFVVNYTSLPMHGRAPILISTELIHGTTCSQTALFTMFERRVYHSILTPDTSDLFPLTLDSR